MSTNSREVCLEIYVNGEFYCTDSVWVPDEEDVQVEFMVTDHIYDLLGCSPGEITAQLEVDTDECMSVSHCALEGDDVQIDIDMKLPTSTLKPKTPENSPTESTKEWMMKKIGGFFLMLFGMDPAVPELRSEKDLVRVPRVPEPEPELDLVGICWPAEVSGSSSGIDQGGMDSPETPEMNGPEGEPVSAEGQEVDVNDGTDASPDTHEKNGPEDASVPESEPELDLVDPKESCVPSVPESESESDLLDSDESCVPGSSSSVPKPDVSTSEQELFPEEDWILLEERVKGCTQRQRPVTAVWNNIFVGNEEIARDRMRLKELGITHVLNAAAVKNKLRVWLGLPWEKDLRETVNTGASYYRGMNIKYCGLPATRGSDISKYFFKAAKFIHKAKKNPENKVFIHCTEGISCAPTLFLAYLMIHHNMTVEEAIDHLIKVRHIKPDTEFLKQLAVLNQDLVHK